MYQKLRHLNAFLTDAIAPSNFANPSSVVSTVGGCTLRPRVGAARTSARWSLNAFASVQFLAFVIAGYSAGSTDIAANPYQKLAFARIAWRRPAVSAGVRGATRASVRCSHGTARSDAPARMSFSPALRMIAAALTCVAVSGDVAARSRYTRALSSLSANALRSRFSATV